MVKVKFLLITLICLFATFSTSAQDDAQKFWKKFQAAVVKGDKIAVANLTKFPLSMPYGVGDVKSKADFIRRYNKIMNLEANAKRCFQAQKLSKDGNGNWSIDCTFKNLPESSDNRPIVYYFAKTKSGWKFISLDNINE